MQRARAMLIPYSSATAWIVTLASGAATGAILGAATSVSATAFAAVTLVSAAAIAVCARLLRAPAA